ncbi:hypothetical protein DIPPA_34571 [Diplonema papillatum]|nr:hypothetical protein DIPPA_34571 [Diplonema papillatum]
MADEEKAAADQQEPEPATEAPKKRARDEEGDEEAEKEEAGSKKRKVDPNCPRESWLDGAETRQETAADFFWSEAVLNEKLGDDFLGPAEIDEVMQSLTSSGDLAAGASIDFEWHAPLPNEADVTPTATLLVTGMRLPFSRLLLRQYLEQRSGPVVDDHFVVVGDSVYVTYNSIDIARRQKRRISGAAWPNRNSNTLSAAFSTLEDAQAEAERANKGTELASSADSRMKASIISNSQKAAEDSKPSRTTLDDLFTRTLAKPRLYFRFENAPHLVKKSRAKVEEDVRKMIRSGSV